MSQHISLETKIVWTCIFSTKDFFIIMTSLPWVCVFLFFILDYILILFFQPFSLNPSQNQIIMSCLALLSIYSAVRNKFLLHMDNRNNVPQIKQQVNNQVLETSTIKDTIQRSFYFSNTPKLSLAQHLFHWLPIRNVPANSGDTKFPVDISFPHDCYKIILFYCSFIYFFQISLSSYSIFFIHPVSPLLYPKKH